ncbi:MAG: flavin reductase family protein [Bacteroidota bacterium]|nr:flavin reductase family protein [Bacteroidota bacterium]MDP4218069.1 flavin reductase family protein [Bacteroidota bacterium]MDP4245731.1 flavin reductase family protein [Bacteroidota bacterium]MDP4255678.1 flavin reductase family protein [Bacteroidota bacterium]MDP4258293.1 flavin reductase family protein [Bacteroidota bacterium]
MIVDLAAVSPAERQDYLQHAIGPRPICFASTVNAGGEVNLSPFSFFNMFSSTPPILIFSPCRRVRDNTTKHTLQNVLEVPEVVINIVDYDLVQQVSLSSCEYARGVNEFVKAGLTPAAATLVRPPLVKESKINIECRVIEVKPLGTEGGAGNLVICEALRMHVADSILNEKGRIDQRLLHHVARLGGNWYARVDEHSLFEVEKPNTELGIGVDALPAPIRESKILSGNDLGRLANVRELPLVDPSFDDARLASIFQYFSVNPTDMERELHVYARELLAQGKTREAWQVLLALN